MIYAKPKKRSLQKFSIFLMIVMSAIKVIGQDNPFDEMDMFMQRSLSIPASPEATAISEYGNQAPNLYTGAAKLSLPIYTIDAQLTQVPISLSYQSNGMRVADKGGRVGTGWSLIAGGAVTRSVVGQPDVCSNYFNQSSEINTHVTNYVNVTDWIDRQKFFEDVAEKGIIDTEPDVYSFTAGSYSGEFYISHDGTLVLMDPLPITIQYTMDCNNDLGVSSFTIGTLEGTTYVFNQVEMATIYYDVPAQAQWYFDHRDYNAAWYLSQITTHNNIDQITFNYDTKQDVSDDMPVMKAVSANYALTQYASSGTGQDVKTDLCDSENYNYSESNSNLVVDKKILSSIVYNSTTSQNIAVQFVNSTQTGYTHLLDNIKVSAGGNERKRYYFDYSTNSVGRDFLISYKVCNGYGEGNDCLNYDIEYNSFNISRTSTGIDHWGYPNGNGSGELLPSYVVDENCTIGLGADREASGSAAGLIKKITYPTGGWTTFDYESHTVKGSSPETTWVDENITLISKSLIGGTCTSCDILSLSSCGHLPTSWYPVPNQLRQEFEIPDQSLIVDGSLELTVSAYFNELGNSDNEYVYIGIVPKSKFDNDDCPFGPFNYPNSDKYPGYEVVRYLVTGSNWELEIDKGSDDLNGVTPGLYYLIMYADVDVSLNVGVKAKVRVQEIDTQINNRVVGGVRVSRVRDYLEDGTLAKEKTYDYDETDEAIITVLKAPNGKWPWLTTKDTVTFVRSSGKASDEAEYRINNLNINQGVPGNVGGGIPSYMTLSTSISTNSISNFASVQGSHVGYSLVTEKVMHGVSSSLGKTEYRFNNPDWVGVSYPYSHQAKIHGAGDLLEVAHYDEDDKILSREITDYEYDDDIIDAIFHGAKVYASSVQSNLDFLCKISNTEYRWREVNYINDEGGVLADQINQLTSYNDIPGPGGEQTPIETYFSKTWYNMGLYTVNSRWTYPKKVTSISYFYDANGSFINSVTKEQNLYHDDPSHQKVTSKDLIESSGRKLVYDYDYNAYGRVKELIKSVDQSGTNYVIDAQLTDGNFFPLSLSRYNTGGLLATYHHVNSNNTNYEQEKTFSYIDGLLVTEEFKGYVNQYLWDMEIPGKPVIKSKLEGSDHDYYYEPFDDLYTSNTLMGSGAISFGGSASYDPTFTPDSGVDYIISYWMYSSSTGWVYFSRPYTGNPISKTENGTTYTSLDEITIIPENSLITTYFHNDIGNLETTCSPDGQVTHFYYDLHDRLYQVKDKDGNVLQEYTYDYAAQ
jgi:hypothetical protein